MLINKTEVSQMIVDEEPVLMQSKVLGVRLPKGVWVWQRPLTVQYQETKIPIDDVTRETILALVGLSILVVLFSLFRKQYCEGVPIRS